MTKHAESPGPHHAHFVWESCKPTRNHFTLFRLDFALEQTPAEALLHLFADTRYRLRVNGVFASAGPARFVTEYPEYDTVDIAQSLRPGANCITVEINVFGASSFQTMKNGAAGFIAWGGFSNTSFATPGAWKVRTLKAWDRDAALFSFALNPAEICDTRKLDEALFHPDNDTTDWESPIHIKSEAQPWKNLAARSVADFPFTPLRPSRITASGSLEAKESLYGFCTETDVHSENGEPTKARVFQTILLSPKDQKVTVGSHWGNYWLNGKKVEATQVPEIGNRSEITLTLNAGKNLFCGYLSSLSRLCDQWDFLLGIPTGCGVTINDEDTGAFLLSPLIDESETPGWLDAGKPISSQKWIPDSGDWTRLTPARIAAWDRMGDNATRNLPLADIPKSSGNEKSGFVWNFEYSTEFLGYACIEIEGPAGTVVDIAFDEWIRDDGLVHLYNTNPFVNTVERFILRGGRQTLQLFHPRGGRYIQVAARFPAGSRSPVILHDIHVKSTQTIDLQGSFKCSDSFFNKLWDASAQTVRVSTEDAYADSPWRERGTYVGDFCVNQQVHRLINHDLRAARRSLLIYAQAQTDNGQILAVAPSWLTSPHEDFSLLWIKAVHDYWSMTGDTNLVEEVWPAIEKLWSSSAWKSTFDCLWDAENMRVFIDWGVLKSERTGQANAFLNALRIATLSQSARLARAIKKEERATYFTSEEKRVRDAYTRLLWNEKEGRYAASLDASGKQQLTRANHANLFAYVNRIHRPENAERLEAYVHAELHTNFERGISLGEGGGHIEFYFFQYLLPHLAETGEHALAEQLIRQHWKNVVDAGYGTLSECFSRHSLGGGSKCHGWSGFPAVYLSRFALGLRQESPGNPDRFILDPTLSPEIDFAESSFPHPKGALSVKWIRKNERSYSFEIDAPPGVDVSVVPSKFEQTELA
ncbi:amylo-alpha-1,6-glucosidase [Pelagicoccus mobilis]|uniref:Alpha-L-rhamnosidase n=1 Tax=Pelagicoccus mobilis TaxID=415221 RepID=A0A934RWR5_9BACT|nr:amylo-alpha-1,6-glucosidase [Pelagicoccus mobilis]MBK1879160.1 hypothetical protein [Pelagicoccus mobilis]